MTPNFPRFAVLVLGAGLLAACATSLAEVGVMKAAENRDELRCWAYKDTDAMQSQRVFTCLDNRATPRVTSTGVGPGPAGLAAGVLGSAAEGAIGAAITGSGGGHSDSESGGHEHGGGSSDGHDDHGGEVTEGGSGDMHDDGGHEDHAH